MAHIAMEWVPGELKVDVTWRKTFKEDLAKMESDWNYAKPNANDHSRWQKIVT